jgi:hypothetical protein
MLIFLLNLRAAIKQHLIILRYDNVEILAKAI